VLTYDEIYIATIGNLKSWWTPVNGPVPVPEGFAESTVSVPRADGNLALHQAAGRSVSRKSCSFARSA